MTTINYLIGADYDGITEESLNALIDIYKTGNTLEKVEIAGSDFSSVVCSFIFKDHGVYNASGFSIGYGGSGPHGLYEVIKMFYPDKIAANFWDTVIPKLDINKAWNWYPEKGFVLA